MPIRIHRCVVYVEVRGQPRGTVLSHCSPFKGRGRGGGNKRPKRGREEETKAGEESKKGKGDGKRKNRGRKGGGSESFSVFYHFVGGVRFINLSKSHG